MLMREHSRMKVCQLLGLLGLDLRVLGKDRKTVNMLRASFQMLI